MNNKITKEILLNAGFEEQTYESNLMKEYQKNNYGIDDFKEFRRWTDDIDKESHIKVDIDNGYNNRGSEWHVHIDNSHCESIGTADINTVEQFNKLMEIFDSNLRL